jgi:hypothetical protein
VTADDELVTHDQVARWLPTDVRFDIDPHEHRWVDIRTMESAFTTRMCTVSGCNAREVDQ